MVSACSPVVWALLLLQCQLASSNQSPFILVKKSIVNKHVVVGRQFVARYEVFNAGTR